MEAAADGGPANPPAHPIDLEGSTLGDPRADLTHGVDGRPLHADARHLADVAKELYNLASYLDGDLTTAAKDIRSATRVSGAEARDHHAGGAMNDRTNPSGRFADADTLWHRYGAGAAAAEEFSVRLHRAIADLAEGTRTIAERYATAERRNSLLAEQVENLLTSSAAGTDSDTAAPPGHAGDSVPDKGSGADGGTGAGTGSAPARGPAASGGYGGGGADE